MKVLFLDIDGVLNSSRSVLTRTGKRLCDVGDYNRLRCLFGVDLPYAIKQSLETVDPIAVDLVNRLLRKDESLRIVLSSTHRAYLSGTEHGNEYGSDEHLEDLRIYLHALGLMADRLIGITPRLYTRRGVEVQSWLNQQSEVTRHCAIDDDSDFDADCNLVHVNAAIGFSAEDYYQVCRNLDINESSIII